MKILQSVSILALVVVSIFSCAPREKQCVDFKTGKYQYIKPEYKRFKITRTETTQTESDSFTGLTIEGTVVWTSECSYKLTYNKVSNPQYSSVIGKQIVVEISNISGDTITCKSDGLGNKMELQMVKVE